MKKVKVGLVGAGNRGLAYCDYSLLKPDRLEVVAICDINPIHLNTAKQRYNVKDEFVFDDLDKFLNADLKLDLIIDATMDEAHYVTAKKILKKGYDLLLEKPITAKKKELLDLQKTAKNQNVFVCHVLRYTPYFKAIKDIIASGKIGDILTMELNEHVWIAHFLDSYVRGKWKSVKECGSGFLLAKSCHDTDIICWLNNKTKPVKVSSFGSRSLFTDKNKPSNATEYCYNCPNNGTCNYSAQKVHLEFDSMPFQTWVGLGKPIDEITKEEKAEYLKHNVYGKCAYHTGGDINDRQTVSIEFENGSTASFTMVGGSSKADRYIHVVCTNGEIEGHISENKFTLRVFDRSEGKFTYNESIVDIEKDIVQSAEYSGHAGGDYAIMEDICSFLIEGKKSSSLTSIQDSVNGHLIVYAAEESVAKEKIIKLKV